ncbi:virulence protein RhuM/Fic/DOC family protein [Candidatus Parcubacteria bacterium]|nr:virulence protein RhuM/Fic/DOC family protein [Candidatus Parcubacteria bacterium]
MPNKKPEKFNKGKIVIYKPSKNRVELKVQLEDETVWLSLNQIAELFGRDKSVISRHLRNIFKEKELSKNSVVARIATTAADSKIYQVEFYSLDAIICVGYRVNSQQATQFRIWATKVLKNYLFKGYAINEKRLLEARNKFNQLQETINFLQKKSKAKLLKGQEKEILNLLADYSKTLSLLEKYDKSKLKAGKGQKAKFVLEYENCLGIIVELKKDLMAKKEAGDIFGNEVSAKFESVAKNLYQTFGNKELYQSIEDKAAHLLYLTIKDHPFIDGNKRIGAFLFVYFLDKNNYLYREGGEKKINDNALTALALLIAESDPKEKEQMTALITQLIK